MSLWYPPEYPHNLLRGLFGDSPYYHVAQNIYEALRAYGGSSPSLANPFATIDAVNTALLAGRQKAAWGRVGNVSYGGSSTRYVNIQTGVANGGSYSGDIGFTQAPSVILAIGNIGATNTDHHGLSVWFADVTVAGFNVCGSAYDMEIGWTHWLCVGN